MIVVSGVIGGGIFFTPSPSRGIGQPRLDPGRMDGRRVDRVCGRADLCRACDPFPASRRSLRLHTRSLRSAVGVSVRLDAAADHCDGRTCIARPRLWRLPRRLFPAFACRSSKFVGVAIIVGLSTLNVLGVKPGTRTTTLLTVIKVATIALMIGLGLFMAPCTPPTVAIDMPTWARAGCLWCCARAGAVQLRRLAAAQLCGRGSRTPNAASRRRWRWAWRWSRWSTSASTWSTCVRWDRREWRARRRWRGTPP